MSESQQPAHSKIGASSYYRWKACPGSVRLSEGVPNRSSSYAQEGTEAHDIAAQMLEDYFFRKGKPNIPANYPSEAMSAIKDYFLTIKKDALTAGCEASSGHVLIEHRFDLSTVHPGLFGTADCILYNKSEKRLSVYDYKHGAGIAVAVENNLQLQYYGLGALLSTSLPVEEVELCIVQPRCDHPDGVIRRWKFEALELLDFAADLADDAKATEDPDAVVVPGDHCRFCPAAGANKCPAIRDKAKALAKTQFKPVEEYDSDKLKEALDFLPVLESWIKQVREFAYGEAQHGRTPAGYKLVAKRATRKWAESDEVVAENLECLLPEKNFYSKKLLSPAQVEKLLPKEHKKDIECLVVKESSGHTLVHESDKRPAVFLDAKSDFKPIEQ